MKNKLFRILLSSLAVSIAATFHLDIFTQGFIVSLSTVILPFLLYLNSDVSSLVLCFTVAIISPIFRWGLFLNNMNATQAFLIVWPDVFFYLSYGILFYIIYQVNERKDVNRLVIAAFVCDFFGNLMEIILRVGFSNLTYDIVSKLLLIAGGRVFMLIVLTISSKYYQSFLINESHELRYRRLLEMTSSFKSEIYFMQKNMDRIEAVMQRSFKAYKIASKDIPEHELKEILLDLSKDVHEIKKDYIRVIHGIEQMSPELLEFKELTVKEIARMLTLNTKEHLLKNESKITFECSVSGDSIIKDHFFFMSVLANLVQNAIEASNDKKNSFVSLKIRVEDDYVTINVKDNGEGINLEHIPHIFNPGFSTKFNPDTGNIGRGVGLVLVKSLVEECFKGSIAVESKLKEGTIFSISIPKNVLKGETS